MTAQTYDAQNQGGLSGDTAGSQPAYWSGVFAMSLCVFALSTSAFRPVSLLTPMAAELYVTEGMAACGAFFMGQFALFTYVRPFLETVTHVNVSTLSLILLVIGVAGFIGTALIGSVLKRGLYGTLIAISVLMAVIALTLIPFGAWVAAVVALLGLWSLMATSAPWAGGAGLPKPCTTTRRLAAD